MAPTSAGHRRTPMEEDEPVGPHRQGREISDGESRRSPVLRRAPGEATILLLPRPVVTPEELTLVRIMAGRICQASLEVLAGTRPIQQLARWLDQRSYDSLLARSALTREAQRTRTDATLRTLHRSAAVRSIHCCPVAAGVYEASIVVAEAHRSRAVALRLEQSRGLWKVTALEIG